MSDESAQISKALDKKSLKEQLQTELEEVHNFSAYIASNLISIDVYIIKPLRLDRL